MSQTTDLRTPLKRLGAHGLTALALAAVTAVVLLVSAEGLLAALVTPGAGSAPAEAREREAEAYSKGLEAHRAQFDGRSILFVPGPPPPPPPPAPVVTENNEPPPPPPPPATYGGPKLIGMVNGVAWFEDGLRLAPGETKSGVHLISIDAPWDAQVEWKGVTFTIGLFARDTLISPRPAPIAPPSEPATPPADKPEPEPDAPPAPGTDP